MNDVNPLQLLVLGLLTAVAVFAGFARRFSISYPIVLVIAGLGCSLIPHVPRIPLTPQLVFLVFLPPLLFSAAWQTSWREFRYNLVSIGLLAVGLVAFTAIGVALTAHFFFPAFDWRLGFLLGAVVSPTDAVAATSIARKVGLPSGVVDILEGESLMNDATGLLALQFGIAMIVSGSTPTVGAGALEFLWLLGGGTLIGLAVGAIVSWLEHFVDDGPVEIAVSLIVAYVAYLAAESAHASGVISTVVCGLYMSRKSSSFFSPAVRLQAQAVWDALEFLLNGLVFILIGLQLPYILAGIKGESPLRLAGFGLGFSALLIALRLLWVFPGARLAWWVRTRLLKQDYAQPSSRAAFVVGWTGMRGVLSLAAASSLPLTLADGKPFPQRNLIAYLTFAVIMVTLVLQGLTLPTVIGWLGLKGGGDSRKEERKARQKLLSVAIDFVEKDRARKEASETHAYDDLLHELHHRLDAVRTEGKEDAEKDQETTIQSLLLGSTQRQRQELNRLRNEGSIGDGVYRTLERELDLGESRLESQRTTEL